MTEHYLCEWKQYLNNNEGDYEYLIQFVENVKNNIPNDKIIILVGPGANGKSTLIRDIGDYLGEDLFQHYVYNNRVIDFIYEQNIKRLVSFSGYSLAISNRKNAIINKQNNALINLIKYKQSFITDTNDIDYSNTRLLEHAKIIKMTHCFLKF